MNTLAPGLSFTDLEFLGTPRVIAAALLHGPAGVAVIDPGPSTTLPRLVDRLASAGIGLDDVTTVVLTHIHLDHAGATGTIVGRNPRVRVYVHEKGAPHLANPEKLLASASRLYGADMDRLWGEVRPVPQHTIQALAGGERIRCAGRELEVAYTPGHASHHVSYFSRETGIAFVGDTAGIRRHAGFALTPTPPPDIDLETWRASLSTIAAWGPATLFVTHFGAWSDANTHLTLLKDNMEVSSHWARESLAHGEDDPEREAWFVEQVTGDLRRRLSEEEVRAYQVAGRFDLSWRGLARYWRQRAK
jgi:glyoxylase-like metal-dependent hydrolase (beta-lactamase superfamily II)